jgi:hypothetical protein
LLIYIILFSNIFLSVGVAGYRLYQSRQIEKRFLELKNKNIQLSFFSNSRQYYFYGIKYNLLDAGIDCSSIKNKLEVEDSISLYWDYISLR